MSNAFTPSPIGPLPNDWACSQIREIVEPTRKVTYGIVQPGSFTENGVLLIRGQDYINGWVPLEEFFLVSPTLHNQFRRSRVQRGDVLMCIVGYTGEANVVPDWIKEANITQTTARLSCDTKKFDPTFLLHFLKSDAGKEQVSKYTKGSAQPGLNLADVEVFFVPSPPLPQQRKIAQILTTVDNLIEKTEALIAKYQAIKQGMMHDLFTRGVDEHGHLRPPYEEAPELYKQSELGWIPKEWNVRPLKHMLSKVIDNRGKTPPFSEIGDHDLIEIASLRNIETSPNYSVVTKYVSTNTFNSWFRDHIQKNDILVSTVGSVGLAAIMERNRGAIAQNLVALRVGNDCDAHFLFHWIRSSHCQQQIRRVVMDAVQPSLKLPHFLECRLAFPPLSEQKRIEREIMAVADSARAESNSLTTLNTLKTGLMQDLLTGKVRVTVDEAEEVAAHD